MTKVSIWRSGLVALALVTVAWSAGVQAAPVKVLINPGDQSDEPRGLQLTAWRTAIEQVLRKEQMEPAVQFSVNTGQDLSATRGKVPDVIVGPAHLIGTAVRFGYTPVSGLQEKVQTVLVVTGDSKINDFQQTDGTRLGVTLQDSIVTYLLRGELNAANTTMKRRFKSVFESRYQDALRICLEMQRCDVVAVEKATVDRWNATGGKFKVIMSSKEVPGIGIAVRTGLKINPESLRTSVSVGGNGATASTVKMEKSDFEYVSTLDYFTPRAVPGITAVDAKKVDELLRGGGVRYIDVRPNDEYLQGHVPGATVVTYDEKSAKDADFNGADDKFDIAKLGPKTPLVIGCNGASCWRSLKASVAATKAGYTVYWHRGGLPDWIAAGYRVDAPSKAAAAL